MQLIKGINEANKWRKSHLNPKTSTFPNLVILLASHCPIACFSSRIDYRSWLRRLAMSICQARKVLILDGKLLELVNSTGQLWEQYV